MMSTISLAPGVRKGAGTIAVGLELSLDHGAWRFTHDYECSVLRMSEDFYANCSLDIR